MDFSIFSRFFRSFCLFSLFAVNEETLPHSNFPPLPIVVMPLIYPTSTAFSGGKIEGRKKNIFILTLLYFSVYTTHNIISPLRLSSSRESGSESEKIFLLLLNFGALVAGILFWLLPGNVQCLNNILPLRPLCVEIIKRRNSCRF